MADKKYDEFPEVTTLLDSDICLISRAPHTPGNTKKYQQVNLKAYVLDGLGTMAFQNANAVAITGGTIDGTPIGATTPSTVKATTLTATALSTMGVVHNTAAGLLTTGLIVSADITANSITNDKLEQMAPNTFKANIMGSLADPQDITVADMKAQLGITTLGSMAFQDSTAISVTGGTINGITIGATTPSSIVSTTLTVNTLGLGVVHSSSGGVLSSSLVVNADISASAAIVDTKLATISTPGKVSNSATSAVSTNTVSTIVLRDGSGNFSAGTITATLSGNATTSTTSTNFTGNLAGDVSGPQGATVIGNATVTNAKMAQMPAHRFKGNNTASPATPLDLTIAEMQAELALGTMAFQNANAVAITGGSISATNFTMSGATHSFNISNGGVFLKFNSVDSLSQNGGAIANCAITNGTITGTAINNAPIGATTPSTGKFTSLEATIGLTLPTPIGGGVDVLDCYQDEAFTFAVTGAWSGDLNIRFIRTGKDITAHWERLVQAIVTGSAKISTAVGAVPARFRPLGDMIYTIPVVNGLASSSYAHGNIMILATGQIVFTADNQSNFGVTGFAGYLETGVSYAFN
jgi:hypothetical protein